MFISTQAEKEWKSVEDKQRFLRLQLLLDKSNIYCQFLLEKMEKQKLEARKQQEKKEHQLEKKQNKEKDSKQMVILICVTRCHCIILGTSLGTKISQNICRFQELTFSTATGMILVLSESCLSFCMNQTKAT